MGHGVRGVLAAALVMLGAVGVAGCKTHTEAVANPCPDASSSGAPQEPKVGLTPDEQKAQDQCSSSNETKDKVCADVDALQTSITDLKHVDVVKNGTSGVQDAFNEVKDNAATLRTDVTSALRSAVDQLDSALTTLRTSIGNVVSQGTAPVKTAAQDAADAARNVRDQARSIYDCR